MRGAHAQAVRGRMSLGVVRHVWGARGWVLKLNSVTHIDPRGTGRSAIAHGVQHRAAADAASCRILARRETDLSVLHAVWLEIGRVRRVRSDGV